MVENRKTDVNKEPLRQFSGKIGKNKQYKDNARQEQDDSRWIELFFSFDVVNSSIYKTINYFGWSSVLSLLFHKLQQYTENLIPESKLWRVLGDEVIFIVRVEAEEDIHFFVDRIFEILVEMIKQIKDGSFFDELSTECICRDIDVMKSQNVISLKCAAWIAVITNDNSNERNIFDNIFVKYKAKEDYEINEYLGNDIDTGFRIKGKTEERRMVLSFELAYLLSARTDSLSCLNIMSYEILKGIWNESLYPIIRKSIMEYHLETAFIMMKENAVKLQKHI